MPLCWNITTPKQVGLGVPYHVAEQLAELSCVLSLLEGVALEGLGHFGIALAVSLTAHGQIHTYLGTFAYEVVVQVFLHLLVSVLGHTDYVFCHKLEHSVLVSLRIFFELGCGSAALGALLRSLVTGCDIAANGANPFFCHN